MAILGRMLKLLDDEERQQMGLGLLYAFRHYVPSAFVNGFVSQSCPLTVEQLLHQLSPAFDDWIVERRVFDIPPQRVRGTYPKHIELRVRKLRDAFASTLSGFSTDGQDDP